MYPRTRNNFGSYEWLKKRASILLKPSSDSIFGSMSDANSFKIIFEIAVGVLIGLLSTTIILAISHKILASKIGWSKNIRHVWLPRSHRSSYSVKVGKKGLADLIETQVRCRLAVRDVLKNGGKLWNFYDIPTSFGQSLKWTNGARVVHLKLRQAKVNDFQRFPYLREHLKIARPDIGLRFEDFFMSYEEVYTQLYLVGNDRMTGVKKLYESPKYCFFQIRSGKWQRTELELQVDNHSQFA